MCGSQEGSPFSFAGIIDDSELTLLLHWSRLHTYYVQYIFNRLYHDQEKISRDEVLRFLSKILQEQEPIFYQYRELLTSLQWRLLQSIAMEKKVEKPTGQEFLRKYEFGNPASVLRALQALVEKEMIVKVTSHEEPFYEVYDVFLSRWLERKI